MHSLTEHSNRGSPVAGCWRHLDVPSALPICAYAVARALDYSVAAAHFAAQFDKSPHSESALAEALSSASPTLPESRGAYHLIAACLTAHCGVLMALDRIALALIGSGRRLTYASHSCGLLCCAAARLSSKSGESSMTCPLDMSREP